MDRLNIFTSTGSKLIHHPGVVSLLRYERKGAPVSLQVAPTSRCNLNCVFCSNANRDKHEDLGLESIVDLVSNLRSLKTIEWTGGGDPTMYGQINEAIRLCSEGGLQQGMITNGVAFTENITRESMARLHWIRISMNCLDYIHDVDLPFDFHGALGFSYVINERTTQDVLMRLHEHVAKYHPSYVRVVPNCQASNEQQEENNTKLSKLVEEWGYPYFYQPKRFNLPFACYWGYFKPFVLHDGWAYPCSSVVLNTTSDKSFHSMFRWVRMEDLPGVYDKMIVPLPIKNCDHCVFSSQNNMVHDILNPSGMENFI